MKYPKIRVQNIQGQTVYTHSTTPRGVRNAVRKYITRPKYTFYIPRYNNDVLNWDILKNMAEDWEGKEEEFYADYRQREDNAHVRIEPEQEAK